ncbi:MgtC/SapB family protein [Rhodovulum sulfidophilum]|uniref:MgtC/SapB family protein n=1 Tax=Rhodovulum sulfidophilum TaxID=35806 RepID=UPI0019218834|nr:MgtC/SapB family protein [Rhodovulum sulfidophilum]MBL3561321.1 MgtC/SapB family protein [Rhodovulum sulfidophilum]
MLDNLAEEFSDPFGGLPTEVAILRLVAAMTLGGLIGFERERRGKPAGLRTHMLIALAACLFTLIALRMIDAASMGDVTLRIDPLRLIEAVTAGVAFLAAGAIITNPGGVRGLTTGAGMWLAGAIGLACGTGALPLAGLATLVALIVLEVVRLLE